MPLSNRHTQTCAALAAAGIALVYALLGSARPLAEWRWIDLIGEGGPALMAAYWMHIVLGSRPAGRVTLLLALGLGSIALGMWADALDEVFVMKQAPRIDKWFESGLVPLGMALLTAGLIGWRREQFHLSEHMQLRERLFREHRDFDRITQLARIDYLREQLALEQRTNPDVPAALVMIEVVGLQAVLHDHGRRDAVRALQAVTHQILLNLRNDDLLCRYSGDRFVLLLPRTPNADAARTARHLEQMVTMAAFHGSDGRRAALQLRTACTTAVGDASTLLSDLNRELECAGFTHRRPASA
ncbi:diguanylate cyclase [Variovorax sp. YR752]|uniref:diguanylate cyclase domain-containing protein n=1 Tax=Variovorax sp. YR752 TaxID=1884383 RepID=UPI00313842B9